MEQSVDPHLQQEVYFLITKYLEAGPCSKSAELLKQELAENELIPKRLDWEGEEHLQTFREWNQRNSHIGPWHLFNICRRLGLYLDREIKPSVPGLPPSLLGAGRQSLLRTRDSLKKTLSFANLTIRRYGCPISSPLFCLQHNIVQVILARETSGPLSRKHAIAPKLYSRAHLLNRTLGHLSAVYCLLFDKTGRYIITGADDLLVKIWSAVDGRLLSTFRGASAEITDIAINVENTLIAAGSLDRLIRVWCLQSSFPVATLTGHTGAITGVNFCPLPVNDYHYLVSTSTDGSVAFWSYTTFCEDQPAFQPKPLQFHEKVRPGQAQMLCAKFSVGGMFLAAGSADHYVRVYSMSGESPHRIMELEKHSDRVDSIQWANRCLKFISGSKDGTAIIWTYRAQTWIYKKLLMSTTLFNKNNVEESKFKLKVTMVSWSADDVFVITAVNDYSLKVWSPATGELLKVLKAHKDEVYVLETHPFDPVFLSAGHDGVVIIWNLLNGETLTTYQNHIEGQGNGAVFDAKWSPDGTMIAATDSHGHLLMFGLAPMSDKMKDLPKELFFHTDYRPLVRDALNQVLDEQTQVPPHLMPPPFLVDIDGNPYPPHLQRLVPGRQNCSTDQLIPNIIYSSGGQQEVIQIVGEARSNIDQMIQELAGRSDRGPPGDNPLRTTTSPRSRINMRMRGDIEGVRQSSGNWQRDGMDWKQGVLVTPLSPWLLSNVKSKIQSFATLELEEYQRENKRVIEVIPETPPVPQNKKIRRNFHSYRTRAAREQELQQEVEDENEDSSPLGDTSDTTAHSEDMMTSSSTESSSTEYSDWVADQGVSLEPPQRIRRKRRKPPPPLPPPPPAAPRPQKKVAATPLSAIPSTSTSTPPVPVPIPAEVPELYRPSEWLSEIIPKKFPYYPQMGDEMMFFAQGYEDYLKAVLEKKIYTVVESQYKPWGKLTLNEPEFVKIIGIKYELRPPRLCCLRLAVIKQNGRISSDRFTIKYHDVPDVIDFFVLKQTYDTAMERQWKIGDRFRSMIDDGWWWGTIESRQPHATSAFLCHKIKWDNGEYEAMSPWDMELPDSVRVPEHYGGSVPVLPEEIAAILYHPRADEWPGDDQDVACSRIVSHLEEVMGLSVAEPFIAPVDINLYPKYSYIVEFPIDLSTIKARFENRFYRRVTAAQFDIRYLATNAEKFNGAHSLIVKHARVVTDLCLKICKDYNHLDVSLLYRQLMESYESSGSESEEEPVPSVSSRERAALNRSLRALRRANHLQPDWRRDCRQLLDVLWNCQDAEPFKEPVDRLEHPDYNKIIDTPMDLGTIREELRGDNYSTPLEFCKDIRTIFRNSRNYNTNKRSKIYVMTVRLSAMAEEHMKRLIQNWKTACRHQNRMKNASIRRKRRKADTKISYDDDHSSDDSNENTRKNVLRLRIKMNDDSSKKGECSKMLNGVTTTLRLSKNSQPVQSEEDDEEAEEEEDEDGEEEEAKEYNANKHQSPLTKAIPKQNGIRSEVLKRNVTARKVKYKDSSSSSENGSSSSEVGNPENQALAKSSDSGSNDSSDGESGVEKDKSRTKDCAKVIGKKKEASEDGSSSSSSSSSSSTSSGNSPTKNWTINGHVKVLRPVRKAAANNNVENPQNSDGDNSESAKEEDESGSGNMSNLSAPSSSEESSEEEYSKPTRSKKRAKVSDSESDSSWKRTAGNSYAVSRPRRSVKKRNYAADSESDTGQTSKPPRRSKKRQLHETDSSDSSTQQRPKISISSRGRIRKITARARAFLKD